MSEIDTYTTEFVEVFGLSFPGLELYTLANSSIRHYYAGPLRCSALDAAVAGRQLKDPFAHRQHVTFTVHNGPIQEYFDDGEHWVHTTLVIPRGINIK
jgi:hypothetical protein